MEGKDGLKMEKGGQKGERPISARGKLFAGKVASLRARNTAVVSIGYIRKVPKYERTEKRRSKIHVHVPEGAEVREGDFIRFSECRKISKTKSHVFLENLSAKEGKGQKQ